MAQLLPWLAAFSATATPQPAPRGGGLLRAWIGKAAAPATKHDDPPSTARFGSLSTSAGLRGVSLALGETGGMTITVADRAGRSKATWELRSVFSYPTMRDNEWNRFGAARDQLGGGVTEQQQTESDGAPEPGWTVAVEQLEGPLRWRLTGTARSYSVVRHVRPAPNGRSLLVDDTYTSTAPSRRAPPMGIAFDTAVVQVLDASEQADLCPQTQWTTHWGNNGSVCIYVGGRYVGPSEQANYGSGSVEKRPGSWPYNDPPFNPTLFLASERADQQAGLGLVAVDAVGRLQLTVSKTGRVGNFGNVGFSASRPRATAPSAGQCTPSAPGTTSTL
jgi:hypothetical protein